MPSFTPEREYLDMEEQIFEAFILAKDSSTINLPEGHFLFSQSLSLDGKKKHHHKRNGHEQNSSFL